MLLKESMESCRWSTSLWTIMGRVKRIFLDVPMAFAFILIYLKKTRSRREKEKTHSPCNNRINADEPIQSFIWAAVSFPKGRKTVGASAESEAHKDWLEGIPVILPGSIKTEESKEDEGAENNAPARELHIYLQKGYTPPNYNRNLLDVRENRNASGHSPNWYRG